MIPITPIHVSDITVKAVMGDMAYSADALDHLLWEQCAFHPGVYLPPELRDSIRRKEALCRPSASPNP